MTEYIFGFHPVREALRHRASEVEQVLVASRRGGRRRADLLALAERQGVLWVEVPEYRLDHLASGGAHNGFGAHLRAEGAAAGQGDPDLIVLVEDVQDPRNLGALLRVCEGAGVGRVLIRDRGSAPLTPAAVKTSAGASEWVTSERITNSARELGALKEHGYWVYGADASGTAPWEMELTGKVVLCIGGEEGGLRERTRALCDGMIGLPMRGRVGSLNLATAAAAILYEAVRQREADNQEPALPGPE